MLLGWSARNRVDPIDARVHSELRRWRGVNRAQPEAAELPARRQMDAVVSFGFDRRNLADPWSHRSLPGRSDRCLATPQPPGMSKDAPFFGIGDEKKKTGPPVAAIRVIRAAPRPSRNQARRSRPSPRDTTRRMNNLTRRALPHQCPPSKAAASRPSGEQRCGRARP